MKTELKSQEQFDTYKKLSCRYCEAPLPPPFLDLGAMALANSFLKSEEKQNDEFICPLSLCWCSTCHLVQLSHVVPAKLMFSNYLYVSSTTKTFQRHFAEYAQVVKKKLQKKENLLAVDIGSNDGLLLTCYEQEGMKAVGVEPATNLADWCNQNNRTTINRFFDEATVDEIVKKFGKASAISANNVFAHIDDIQAVCRNVSKLLDEKGIFVIEFPYLMIMLDEMLFDMIYHEHLSYIALRPLQFLLSRHQLEIFDIQPVASHGGSLRVFIQKKGAGYGVTEIVRRMMELEKGKGYGMKDIYREFADRVRQVKKELSGFVSDLKKEGKSICGYGAPAKGNTLINYCHFTSKEIDYLVDDNPLKQNMSAPGSKIPVVSSERLFAQPTDYVIIFAWNFAKEIMEKLKPLRDKGVKFVIPLPKPVKV